MNSHSLLDRDWEFIVLSHKIPQILNIKSVINKNYTPFI